MRRVFVLALAIVCAAALQPAGRPASRGASAGAPDRDVPGRAREQRGARGREVEPDDPGAAMRWRRLSWLDEHHRIAPGALAEALRQRAVNVALHEHPQFAGGLVPTGWVSRGPQNVGGRTRSLLFHPTNPDVMWAGAVGGGIWKTVDRGQSWRACDDFLPSLAATCLAIDPSNPDTLFCGTGEGFFNGDALGGAGVFRSTDGGVRWTQVPSTSTWGTVNRIVVSPQDPAVMLASTGYGGVQRSTDGGQTWTTAYWAQWSFDVAFDPANGANAVAQVLDYDGAADTWFQGALYSRDGGQSWQAAAGLGRIDGFWPRIELAYAPSDPRVVYASVAVGSGQVWRSTDGGRSYSLVLADAGTGASWYSNALWVCPTDPDFVMVGGYAVFASHDAGASFAQVSDGYILTDQVHPDVHLITSDPRYDGVTNRTVWACADGGMFRADDVLAATTGSGWVSVVTGYQTTQFYGADGMGGSGLVIAGSQDNGTLRSVPGVAAATMMFGGDGGFCAIDSSAERWCYGEYITLQLNRSDDGGRTADWMTNGLGDAGNAANFIAPFILDPSNPRRLLAGGASLWVTDDARAPQPAWRVLRDAGSDLISAIAVAPSDPDVIWVAQNDGAVFRTADGRSATPTWVAVDDNATVDPLPGRYPTRIIVDPEDPLRVDVAFGGFSDGNLQETTDGGETWVDITGTGATGLPEAPIRGVARHPWARDWIYVGTEVGVFASENGGLDWAAANEGPANVSVDELVFMHGSTRLLAATHGRGLWTAETCPPAPARLLADNDGGPRVLLTWSATPGVSEYRLYRGTTPSGPFTFVAAIPAPQTQYWDDVAVGGTYSYVVRAFAGCESPDSETVTAMPCSAPAAVTLSATDPSPCLPSGVDLAWPLPAWGDPLRGARLLAMLRDGQPIVAGGCADLAEDATTCRDDAAPAGSHVYALRLTNACGRASTSSAVTAADVVLQAPRVGGLRLLLRRTGRLEFRWTDAPGVPAYVLVRDCAAGGPFATAAGTAPSGTTGLSVGVPPDRLVFFQVAGVNACGRGAL